MGNDIIIKKFKTQAKEPFNRLVCLGLIYFIQKEADIYGENILS